MGLMKILGYLNLPKDLLAKLGVGNKTGHVCQAGLYLGVILVIAVSTGVVELTTIQAIFEPILKIMALP